MEKGIVVEVQYSRITASMIFPKGHRAPKVSPTSVMVVLSPYKLCQERLEAKVLDVKKPWTDLEVIQRLFTSSPIIYE